MIQIYYHGMVNFILNVNEFEVHLTVASLEFCGIMRCSPVRLGGIQRWSGHCREEKILEPTGT
jgi:hypothetical protein